MPAHGLKGLAAGCHQFFKSLASLKKPVLQSWASLITATQLETTAALKDVKRAGPKGKARGGLERVAGCFENNFEKHLTTLRKRIKISPLCC